MIDFPTGTYRCIVIDPPWPQESIGRFKVAKHQRPDALPYDTMTVPEIAGLPIARLAELGTHLWLWTTNSHLRDAFDVLQDWGFTYLTTVTWVKPSGLGAWFASTTQHCLFGYYQRCEFSLGRYKPTHFTALPPKHSAKPAEFYHLVRSISPEPRIDLFSRRRIDGFDSWGDEAPNLAEYLL